MELLVLFMSVAVLFFTRPESAKRFVYRVTVNGKTLSHLRASRASRFSSLQTGLLNHLSLPENEALWLPSARSVHTRGMHFTIDVVFVDRKNVILQIEHNCLPGMVIRGPRGCRGTVELASGVAAKLGLMSGMQVEFEQESTSHTASH